MAPPGRGAGHRPDRRALVAFAGALLSLVIQRGRTVEGAAPV
jgi:hypothetical protein